MFDVYRFSIGDAPSLSAGLLRSSGTLDVALTNQNRRAISFVLIFPPRSFRSLPGYRMAESRAATLFRFAAAAAASVSALLRVSRDPGRPKVFTRRIASGSRELPGSMRVQPEQFASVFALVPHFTRSKSESVRLLTGRTYS